MRSMYPATILAFSSLLLLNGFASQQNWITVKHQGFNIICKPADKIHQEEYSELILQGIVSINVFFNDTCRKDFDVIIHPDRHSLDSSWQKDWDMPDFRSECWMVASGVADRLDLLSPIRWKTEACEHDYAEKEKTQQLITHELVHVYHGQLNVSPDFSNVEGIDWFVEGLATYVSGQCDSIRIASVKKAIASNQIPESLDNFWTGKLKYGLSGSIVMYIDNKYGRSKLKELLPLNKKTEILNILKTTEKDLLEGWKDYIRSL